MSGAAPNPIRYGPRQVVDLGLVEHGWTAKLYAILSERWAPEDLPPHDTLGRLLWRAMDRLDAPLDHECGFAIFHMADDGIYLLATRFNNANNLRHEVYQVTPTEDGYRLDSLAETRIVACVWELRLMLFEADAWIDCVLKPGLAPATLGHYCARRYQGEV